MNRKITRKRMHVASISERIFVRVRHLTLPEIMMEMEVDEAKNLLRELSWHVDRLESGESVMPDFHTFLHTLPKRPPFLK